MKLPITAKARQMLAETTLEGIRFRLAPVNEQVFRWANVPLSALLASIWIKTLAGLDVYVESRKGVAHYIRKPEGGNPLV